MISQSELENIVAEIGKEVSYMRCDKKTRYIIINSLRSKLDPSIRITCDESNNGPEIMDSGKIWAHLEWFENNTIKFCDIIFGETITLQEFRDIRIDEILKK
jgi:hypothetical protein